MNRGQIAKQYFIDGYNCCQAVVLAYSDLIGLSEIELSKLTLSLGAGVARLREVCGAVSGMSVVISYLYSPKQNNNLESKADIYSRVQELALQFEKEKGSIVCRELLNLKDKHSNPVPQPRTKDYFDTRPCPTLIEDAANLLAEYIKSHPYK